MNDFDEFEISFSSIGRAGEVQVLDFQTQQGKLFPQIAAAYALIIAGHNMMSFYLKVTTQIDKGALEELPQVSG